MYEKKIRGLLIKGNKNYSEITKDVLLPIEKHPPKWWYFIFAISLLFFLYGTYCTYKTVYVGIGTWGLNNSQAWGWDIINYVWWIGIGLAGTALSVFFLLLRQRWRTSVSRAAEAMTVVAVSCAGLFPLIHMGRCWMGFYVFPYPNTRGPLWVNFDSPLFWDVLAIGTYLMASAVFWYIGMIPDFASIRDKTKSKIRRVIYNFLSSGWTGSARSWIRFDALCMILAGLITPLVVIVHSVVAMDFATAVIPGWHSTIFPPYFVVGAIFSGFAMVLIIIIFMRRFYHYENYITLGHINAITKILVFLSFVMGISYITEIFIAWYSGNEYELFTYFRNRITGDYMFSFWSMIACNVFIPQLFWSKKIRNNLTMVVIISLFINLGMWLERYVIIVTSLTKDYLPSDWVTYKPTYVEVGLFLGTLSIFILFLLAFFKWLPMMSISELKGILKPTSKED